MHAGKLFSLAVVLALAPFAFGQVNFATAVDVAAGDGTQTFEGAAIAAGDFDEDGDIDLVVTSTNLDLVGDPVVILANNGNGGFTIADSIDLRRRPAAAVAADLNDDGHLDLAIVLLADDEVAVLLGDGTGAFGAEERYLTGNGPVHITAGDVDGQSGLDLVVANEQADTITVFFNDGDANATFTMALDVVVSFQDGPSRSEPNGTAIGDFDGDGDNDIAVSLAARNQVDVLFNDGTGDFGAYVLYDVGGDPEAIAAALLNDDAYVDLAVANRTDDTINVLLNNGAGAFTVLAATAAGNAPTDLVVADMDDDNMLDLVTANREGDNVSVLLGDGDGTFDAPDNFNVGGGPVGLVVADLDDDDLLDIATINQESSLTDQDEVSILLATEEDEPGTDGSTVLPRCGNFGGLPFFMTVLGLVAMKRRVGRP
ncbi:MAG: VCBS repeat-containing protein [Phycisphaerae bacterium]|jgi:hypothetical protein